MMVYCDVGGYGTATREMATHSDTDRPYKRRSGAALYTHPDQLIWVTIAYRLPSAVTNTRIPPAIVQCVPVLNEHQFCSRESKRLCPAVTLYAR